MMFDKEIDELDKNSLFTFFQFLRVTLRKRSKFLSHYESNLELLMLRFIQGIQGISIIISRRRNKHKTFQQQIKNKRMYSLLLLLLLLLLVF